MKSVAAMFAKFKLNQDYRIDALQGRTYVSARIAGTNLCVRRQYGLQKINYRIVILISFQISFFIARITLCRADT